MDKAFLRAAWLQGSQTLHKPSIHRNEMITMPKEEKDMKAHKWRREQIPKILANTPKPKKRGRPRKKSVESGEENDGEKNSK